ncbi:putative quinol monooxygenase [Thalassovita mediterranea]|uniref:Antibiotic biosynthesis monooxygenase n=1 Tax=Thalassovita mediterranea TaxID=340021 RepID=A0A0N7M1F1_9RHOB|nr:antibiotic biosynthesis monooxygenase [Thalassovita mediterranea]CUH83131.1 Antibiotic biosynthesis monooxygenase [Thalassovita mediterranea]SIS33285.1 Quinol monooxygenase YgiN [Thalassovita mediterranea]
MTQKQIQLTGAMICTTERLAEVRAALPEHIRLTRLEPGCLKFDVVERDGGRFEVDELFSDRAAFDAHQARGAASDWARVTAGLPREYEISEV